MFKRWVFAVIFLALLSGCVNVAKSPSLLPAQAKGDMAYLQSKLNTLIEKEMHSRRIVGLSLALTVEGRTLWQGGYGYADKASKTPASAHTKYRAGSISKLFNSIAVMQLAEQGLLDLDVPIRQYLNEFDIKSRFEASPAITTRHLLTHLSGLPSDLIKGMWRDDPDSFRAVLPYLNNTYVANPPNTLSAYSNVAHSVIGLIIERVTMQPYEEYMQVLLHEMNMPESDFSAELTGEKAAAAYRRGRLSDALGLRDVPAAGLNTSVAELSALLKLVNTHGQLTGKRLLMPSSVAHMLNDYSDNAVINLGQRMALGWFFADDILTSKQPAYRHSGASIHHRAFVLIHPRHQLGVVLLSNSQEAGAILADIAKQAIGLLYEYQTGYSAPLVSPQYPKKQVQDMLTARDLEGYYATLGGLAHVFTDNKKLKTKIAGRVFDLYQRSPGGLYFLRYHLFGIIPINIKGLAYRGFSVRQLAGETLLISSDTLRRKEVFGKRIYASAISPSWRNRLGRYRILNPLQTTDFPNGGLVIENGFLIAHAKTDNGIQLKYVLDPQNDQEAIVSGIGRNFGETVHVDLDENGDEILRFAGLMFQKLKP